MTLANSTNEIMVTTDLAAEVILTPDLASESDLLLLDFVNKYTNYADVYEVPEKVHEAIAIALVAACANGKVWIEWGDKQLSLDCWTLITTPSGGGRNTAVRKCRPILKAAEQEHLIQNVAWGSESIVKQHFAEHPNGLYIWTEMSEKLQDLNRSQFAGVKPWITDLYDETTPPPNKIYRYVEERQNTPAIKFTEAPRTSFLATSSYEWLVPNLTRVDSTGGFLARWMLVHVQGSKRRIAIPQKSDDRMIAPLASRLRQIANLAGNADLSDVQNQYVKWYDAAATRFESQPNQALAEAFWNRHRDHVLKLAVIFELSDSGTLAVTPDAMSRAMRYAKKIEGSICSLLPTGFDRSGYELERMIEQIKNAGAEGLPLSEFTRAFKNVPGPLRADRIRTMAQCGDVHGFLRATKGRTASMLVHKDFRDEYQQSHPGEDEVEKWNYFVQ